MEPWTKLDSHDSHMACEKLWNNSTVITPSYHVHHVLSYRFLIQMQTVVDKMLAFDVHKGDLGLFFQDLFSPPS